MRQRDAAGEQRRHQPAGRPGLEHRLLQRDRVEQVAALAADLSREGDAEQPLLRGGLVQLARHRRRRPPTPAGAAPPRGARTRAAVSRSARRSAVTAAPPRSSTCRDRSHSPSPLACGSNRVDAATPSPSRPWITMLTAPRFGQQRTPRRRGPPPPAAARGPARVDQLGQPRDALGVLLATPSCGRPTARCSRRRPCRRSGRARTCPAAAAGSITSVGAGYGEGCGRRRPVRWRTASGSAITSRRPSACTTVCSTCRAVDVRRPVDAVRRRRRRAGRSS